MLGGAGGSIEVAGDDATLAEAVSQKVLPSVVNIDVYSEQQSYGMFGMYGYSDGGSSETLSSLGSGVLISDDGYILTNDHVVEGADRLMVTLCSGKPWNSLQEGVKYVSVLPYSRAVASVAAVTEPPRDQAMSWQP